MFSVNSYVGKKLAHRLSFEFAKGRIPKGAFVLHSCDNPLCVNPEHLRIGTAKDNVADMDARGRRRPNPVYGEDNVLASYTENQVRAARAAYLRGETRTTICSAVGVTDAALAEFVSGRAWAHTLDDAVRAALKREGARRTRNNAHLDAAKVAEIRRRLDAGDLGIDLAAEFGVHKATISDIKQRKTWNS